MPLGCPKNDVDSEYMLGILERAGARIVAKPEQAELIIVNTCAFIEPAVEQSVKALLAAAETRARVICAGCLPARYGRQLMEQLPEVHGFVGPGGVDDIAEVVAEALRNPPVWHVPPPERFTGHCDVPRRSIAQPWTHAIKIADGCSHACTFCTIPAIRGRFRSRPLDDLLREAERAAQAGVREICLVAQDTSSYGSDLGLRDGLALLLEKLGELLPQDIWLRVQYLHPDCLTSETIAAMLEVPQVVPYFDLPFQHCAERILRAMGRRGNAEAYHLTVASIRQTQPLAAVRATFIVGFPGETASDFHQLLDFVDLIEPDHVAVFPYWPEEGTPAASLPNKVKQPDIRRRLEELQETARKIAQVRSEMLIGQHLRVLVEDFSGKRQAIGRTFRDAPGVDGQCYVRVHQPVDRGSWISVEITDAEDNDLHGRSV
ncbi:MAG: 30S ribosomal protein S12 methylthiotransferase RimO [Armatimonadetes bacterium]|nr:30S ribosomal protein S12 methylthiotransferase RimO [Armatimonadota bacterium]